MRGPILQPGAGLGRSDPVGSPKTRVKATDLASPSYSGSGVQKRGKRSTQHKARHPICPLDSASDQLNAPRKANRVRSEHVGSGMGNESRVACPFYKYDPKTHQMSSCKGKGFNELAKMKDHFKQVHGSSQEVHDADLNFKKKEYTGLKTLKEKWRLVFHRLFPHVAPIPSPYANEDEDNDAFLQKLAKAAASKLKDKRVESVIIELAREMKENRFARSTSVDSAVEFEIEDSRVAKVDVPMTPPSKSYESSSEMANDEAYSEPSPELGHKVIRKPDAHAQSTVLPLPYPWSFGTGLTLADDRVPDTESQPLQVVSAAHSTLPENDSYFDLSHEHTPQSCRDPDAVKTPFTGQGYASPHLDNSPFAVSSHQTNDSHLYHDFSIAPTALDQNPRYLSKESSELLPATHPSLEEQNQVWTSSMPSEYLQGLNGDHNAEDWVLTSMLSADVWSSPDQGIFVGA